MQENTRYNNTYGSCLCICYWSTEVHLILQIASHDFYIVSVVAIEQKWKMALVFSLLSSFDNVCETQTNVFLQESATQDISVK